MLMGHIWFSFSGSAYASEQAPNGSIEKPDRNSPAEITSDEIQSHETQNDEDEFFDSDFDLMEDEFEEVIEPIADPFSPWNRVMFEFNDRLYFWVLKPVSKGYKAVTPEIFRTGIKNFFYNIRMPIRFAGCLLQGKGKKAANELSGFIINSTAGGLGFGNAVKAYPHLNPSEEDFGQTLGRYGIGNGFYIVWPFIGSSSLRDTIGLLGDGFFLDPVSYIKPPEAYVGLTVLETVNNTSLRIGDYEKLKDSAFKPYEAFRDIYVQYRLNLVSK